MSDFVIGQIRTYVPIIAGVVASWLLAQGILDEETAKATVINLTALLTGVFSGLYYFLVRLLAEWKPQFGWLLGVNKAPEYGSSE
jgi:formate hydrogenlyase subunit 3/multisubunit Na+/H+ antiporter MnhD subunit